MNTNDTEGRQMDFDAVLQRASIAVESVEDAAGDFEERMGLERVGPVRNSELGFDLRWQTMGVDGDGWLDLIESSDESSLIAKFLRANGEGLYLVQLGVGDLLAARDFLASRGARLIGVDVPDEELRMFWIHPQSTHGVLIEVIARDPE